MSSEIVAHRARRTVKVGVDELERLLEGRLDSRIAGLKSAEKALAKISAAGYSGRPLTDEDFATLVRIIVAGAMESAHFESILVTGLADLYRRLGRAGVLGERRDPGVARGTLVMLADHGIRLNQYEEDLRQLGAAIGEYHSRLSVGDPSAPQRSGPRKDSAGRSKRVG